MTKKLLFLLVGVLLLPSMLIADSSTSDSKNPTPPKPQTPSTVPVVIADDRPTAPGKGKPGKRYEVMTYLSGGTIGFDIPLDAFPMECELIQETYPFGYWTATFTDAASCEMPFDGTVGDYRLTLTTAGNSTYTGYFTLE